MQILIKSYEKVGHMSSYIILFAILAGVIYAAIKVGIPYKSKRWLKRIERVQNNLTNVEVKSFIWFVMTRSLIKTPDVIWALTQLQKQVNSNPNIEAEQKLRLYKVLSNRGMVGLQRINKITVDKHGNKIDR